MASGDSLGIGISGLLTSQRQITTTSHNIANAQTEGYSRQRVQLATRPPQVTSAGNIGKGVTVDGVRRFHNDFLTAQVRDNTTRYAALDKQFEYTSQLDRLLSDPDAGLAPAMQGFFNAVQGVADDPSSTSARQVMLTAAGTLEDRFGYLNDRFDELREAADSDLRVIVDEVNNAAAAIADLNRKIAVARGGSRQPPNDLLDRRDELLRGLAEKINVTVTSQDDGSLNVFVGKGQTLVIGQSAARLDLQDNPFDPRISDIVFVGPDDSRTVVTKFMTGGTVGGLVNFNRDILDRTQSELGRIAFGLAKAVNDQHRLGMDLNNLPGRDFFRNLNEEGIEVLPSNRNAGDYILGATVTNLDKIKSTDYRLDYRDGTYTLVRLSDDTVVDSFSSLPRELPGEGFTLSLTSGSGIQDGDSFLIRPARSAADRFRLLLDNTTDIAAASLVRSEAAIANQGEGEIRPPRVLSGPLAPSPGGLPETVVDLPGRSLPPQLEVVFTSASSFDVLDVSDPAAPVVLQSAVPYDPAAGAQLRVNLPDMDFAYATELRGVQAQGDRFRIQFNRDAVGDNANALNMALLQDASLLLDGSASFGEAYGQLVARVGSKTHELDINREAQKVLLDNAIAERETVSGVNLDEEAANLVRFQNIYNANAQVVATASELFDTFLASLR